MQSKYFFEEIYPNLPLKFATFVRVNILAECAPGVGMNIAF